MKALLVDDHAMFRDGLSLLIEQRFAGVELLHAASLAQALSLNQGAPNKVICRELDVSESTIKSHVAAIFRQLDVNNRTQAVFAAARLGLRLPH